MSVESPIRRPELVSRKLRVHGALNLELSEYSTEDKFLFLTSKLAGPQRGRFGFHQRFFLIEKPDQELVPKEIKDTAKAISLDGNIPIEVTSKVKLLNSDLDSDNQITIKFGDLQKTLIYIFENRFFMRPEETFQHAEIWYGGLRKEVTLLLKNEVFSNKEKAFERLCCFLNFSAMKPIESSFFDLPSDVSWIKFGQ
jgi:hypothetical protein